MDRNSNDNINSSIKRNRLIFILNIIVIILLIVAVAGIYTYSKLEKQAMIGKLYTIDTDLSKTAVKQVLNPNISSHNLKKGVEAFKAAGYTENAFTYLQVNSNQKMIVIIFVIAVIIILALLVFNYHRLPIPFLIKRTTELENTIDNLRKDLKNKTDYLTYKNKELQEFTENISHQIRTPLAALSLSLDLIKSNNPEQEMVEDCFIQIERIEKFITRLLKISRLESGKTVFTYNDLNLTSCIKNAAELCESNSCSFEFDMDNQCMINGDEEWLIEAFINIFNNCASHSEMDGCIKAKIHEYEESVQIKISDNGEGIPEEGVPFIFDRFNSIKKSHQKQNKSGHNGIGLNLSKLIFEKHRGAIAAYNNEEGGATFVISIPKYILKSGKKVSDIL